MIVRCADPLLLSPTFTERSRRDLQSYTRSLLASCEGGAGAADGVTALETEMKKLIASPPQTLRQLDAKGPTNGAALPMRRNSSVSATGEEEVTSCKSAIEVLTRNSQKGEWMRWEYTAQVTRS